MKFHRAIVSIPTAALLAAALAGPAVGQEVINVSGATLFRDFFISNNAGTHDFLDVDGDGRVTGFNAIFGGIVVDQLAQNHASTTAWDGTPFNPANPSLGNSASNAVWRLQYRATGSVNGLRDLINWRNSAAPATLGGNAQSPYGDPGFVNRTQFSTGSGATGIGNTANPAAVPYLSGGTAVPGMRVDIAPLDVPTAFAVQSGGSTAARWNLGPTQAGYGQNQINSATGQSNQLITATPTLSGQPAVNFNTAAPDANTVFDTQVAWSPVAFIVNRGVGLGDRDSDGQRGDIKKSELQHLFTTGRTNNGENLIVATRDSGSGTRNAAMNSIGVDPSWGRGDNQHNEGASSSNDNLGTMEWTNRASSSRMEAVVRASRLAVGYSGLQGGSAAAVDRIGGDYEIANIQNDIVSTFVDDGSFDYVRPTIDAVLDNLDPESGYQVGGSQTFATVGDPLATRTGNDTRALTGNPAMQNTAAADYINNITAAIAAFNSLPSDPANFGTPGELLAFNFTLVGATDGVSVSPSPEQFVANAQLNQALQDFTRANSLLNTNENPGTYGGINAAGEAGTRANIAGFSDATINASTNTAFIAASGALVNEGAVLTARNEVAGDFNNDGQRNLADAARMVDALEAAEANTLAARQAWAAAGSPNDGDLVFEIAGDFNADGSFNRNDLRYWADGLAMTTGPTRTLDRKAGFTAIDNNITGGNAFGTTLATGKAYAAGDARADIAGSTSGANAGGLFQGHDGTVNAADIDYLYAQFVGNAFVTDGAANWSNLDEAVGFDLSADMTGDLIVNQLDVDEIVEVVLGTFYGDANLDGQVDGFDFDILAQAFSTQVTSWSFGDFTGDGSVDGFDFDLLAQNFGLGTGSSLIGLAATAQFISDNAQYSEFASLVPEPTTLGLFGLATMGLMRRRANRA